MTEHEILVKARNRIDSVGWANFYDIRAYTDPDAAGCLIQTIRVASGSALPKLETKDAYHQAQRAILRLSRYIPWANNYVPLHHWNDYIASKEDVKALLDFAIAQTAPEPNVDFLDAASLERQTEDAVAI